MDTTLSRGTLDAAMDLSALLASPLEGGFTLEVPVFSPRRGVSRMEAEVTGSETLTVPAGEFETWVVEMSSAGQNLTLYVTREAPRMLVRQEMAGRPVTLELEDIGRGGGG